MKKWFLAIAAGIGLSVWADGGNPANSVHSDIAREIQDWEVQTGQLPRDPNEKAVETPAALAGEWHDPFFTDKLRIHFRRASANVRLTIFEGGHVGNMSAGFEWLGRQRCGKPADWSVAATGGGAEDVSTK